MVKYPYKVSFPSALYKPIPTMHELRQRKIGYRDIPIDRSNSRYNEPVVDLAGLGLAGQAYYSRSNATLDQAVPGVNPKLYLRRSIAQELARINTSLANPVIVDLFGSSVELYFEDALRPVSLQQQLHDQVFPDLLTKAGLSGAELEQRRSELIAAPSHDPDSPPPHSTGGAFDVRLRYTQSTRLYVPDVNVWLGYEDAETTERVNPDYYEWKLPATAADATAQRHRRAFYAILTGAAFGVETGFVVNPTESWHYSRGDQMWARLSGNHAAYYSRVETPG